MMLRPVMPADPGVGPSLARRPCRPIAAFLRMPLPVIRAGSCPQCPYGQGLPEWPPYESWSAEVVGPESGRSRNPIGLSDRTTEARTSLSLVSTQFRGLSGACYDPAAFLERRLGSFVTGPQQQAKSGLLPGS